MKKSKGKYPESNLDDYFKEMQEKIEKAVSDEEIHSIVWDSLIKGASIGNPHFMENYAMSNPLWQIRSQDVIQQ